MLPKTAEYALRAFVGLATNVVQREAAGTLAARIKVPRRNLNKVLQEFSPIGLFKMVKDPLSVLKRFIRFVIQLNHHYSVFLLKMGVNKSKP